MKQTIKYLNTDLDLIAPFDLDSLAQALAPLGVFALHVSAGEDLTWYACFECEEGFSYPEPNIASSLTAVESLDPESRRIWNACTKREFNIGYDCGDEPWAFNNEITVGTMSRMAALNISLRITLYSAEPPQSDPKESKDQSTTGSFS